MKIEINPDVLRELEYLINLHRLHDAPNPQDSVDELVNYLLASVADGSSRPGSWEREMLNMMGLVAFCDEHQRYRANYGPPPRLRVR